MGVLGVGQEFDILVALADETDRGVVVQCGGVRVNGGGRGGGIGGCGCRWG